MKNTFAEKNRTFTLVETAFDHSKGELVANPFMMKDGITGEEVMGVLLLPAHLSPKDEGRLKRYISAYKGPWCINVIVPRSKAMILRPAPGALAVR